MPSVDFWEERYKIQNTPWDLGKPVPIFHDIAPRYAGKQVLVLGCGRGYDAICFAQAGCYVTAIDFSPTAIKEARMLAKQHQVDITFTCADFFSFVPNMLFDTVVEHTFFCAIHPAQRADYIDKVYTFLKPPPAFLIGMFFTTQTPSGPPYGIEKNDLLALIEGSFNINHHQDMTAEMQRSHLLLVEEYLEFEKESRL